MTDRELELKLKAAVERSAPDGLDRLLSQLDGKGAVKEMTDRNKNKIIDVTELSEPGMKKRRRSRWAGIIAACLAVALIGGAGGYWYGRNYAVATVVSLDVNPSIELKVSAAERVLKCSPLNGEAVEILSSMSGGKDLEGAKLDVAVNAVVGAIVRAGYLDSLNSAILISVDDKDSDRGARLQAQLVAAVDGVLQTASNGASVMSQYGTYDAGLTDKAKQNNISTGKAALIEQVTAINPSLDFAALAELTVEELRDLVYIGAPAMPIGRTAAGVAAEKYAGTDVLSTDTVREVDPELDSPVPHYEVELVFGNRDYEYRVDAFTGEVLSGRADIVGGTAQGADSQPAVNADRAFDLAAEFFSKKHPELVANFLNIETDLDADRDVYEVDFWCFGYEFEYGVDATTGDVVWEETSYRSPGVPATETPTVTDIGVDAAKAAALEHAKLTETQVTFIMAVQDREDGKLVYEVDFYTASTEYDYVIDAATGSVVKYETEARPGASAPATNPNATAGSDVDIGEEAAKSSALTYAGCTQADWIRCKREYDDGRYRYELEFECDGMIHDCDVDAYTGEVLSHESEPCHNALHHHNDGTHHDDEHHDDSHHGTTTATTDIGADAAASAALSHAGLSKDQVTGLRCQRDYDDGRLEYEVEFRSGRYEYEYKIDAATGSVLEHEKDWDD